MIFQIELYFEHENWYWEKAKNKLLIQYFI